MVELLDQKSEIENLMFDIQKETQQLSDQIQETIKQPSYDHKKWAINFPYHRKWINYNIYIKPEKNNLYTIEGFKNWKREGNKESIKIENLYEFNAIIGGKLNLLVKDPGRTSVPEKWNAAYQKLEALMFAKEKGFKLDPIKKELELSIVHTVPVYNDFVVTISQTKDGYLTKIKESKYSIFSTKFESKNLEESIQKASSYLINHVSPNAEAYKPLKEKTKIKMDDAKTVYNKLILNTNN